jgi:peptidoglycan/LPS O-acetylase OafA/YrhL
MTATRDAPHRLAAFDGLRACAALSVLAYHVGLACALSRHGSVAPLISELKAGVAVFFVISGCLLYLPYAEATSAGSPLPDWRRYAHRRALRILPAYWLALTLLAIGPLRASVVSTDWWRYYGLEQTYSPDTMFGGVPVAWSLCVEVAFYVLLPVLGAGMARIVGKRDVAGAARRQLMVLGGVGAAALVVRWLLLGSLVDPVPQPGLVLATALPSFIDWFALGMCLAVLATTWRSGQRLLSPIAWLSGHPGACWILAFVCFAAGAITQEGDLFLPMFGVASHAFAGLGGALLVLPAIGPSASRSRAPVLRVLRHPLAVWLGTISYGIYLWHVPLLEAVRGPLTQVPSQPASLFTALGLLTLAIVGASALGAASWYLVERPARRLLTATRKTPAIVAEG